MKNMNDKSVFRYQQSISFIKNRVEDVQISFDKKISYWQEKPDEQTDKQKTQKQYARPITSQFVA